MEQWDYNVQCKAKLFFSGKFMCAIYGAISLKDSVNVFDIAKMGSLLKHRGPDASAIIDFGPNNTFNRFDFSPKNLNSKSPLLDSKKKLLLATTDYLF